MHLLEARACLAMQRLVRDRERPAVGGGASPRMLCAGRLKTDSSTPVPESTTASLPPNASATNSLVPSRACARFRGRNGRSSVQEIVNAGRPPAPVAAEGHEGEAVGSERGHGACRAIGQDQDADRIGTDLAPSDDAHRLRPGPQAGGAHRPPDRPRAGGGRRVRRRRRTGHGRRRARPRPWPRGDR